MDRVSLSALYMQSVFLKETSMFTGNIGFVTKTTLGLGNKITWLGLEKEHGLVFKKSLL